MNRALHIATFIFSGGAVCLIANTAASPSHEWEREREAARRVDAGASHPSPPLTWRIGMTAPVIERAGAVSISDASEPTELILSDSQIFGGRLATVAHFFVAHLGTLIEAAQSRFFDGRYVHEDILAATVGLNKSIAFSGVEPLNCTCRHVYSPHRFENTK